MLLRLLVFCQDFGYRTKSWQNTSKRNNMSSQKFFIYNLKLIKLLHCKKKCMVAGGLEPAIPQLLAQCSSIVPH